MFETVLPSWCDQAGRIGARPDRGSRATRRTMPAPIEPWQGQPQRVRFNRLDPTA